MSIMIGFERPLLVLVAIAIAIAYFVIAILKGEKLYHKRNKFYNPLIKHVSSQRIPWNKVLVEHVFTALALFLIVVALAGPYVVVTSYKTVNLVSQANLKIKAKPAVVLIIDTSGSMQGVKIAEAKEALIRFVKIIDGKADIGLISFASTVKTAIPPTSNTSLIISEIRKLQASGGTMYQYPLITALDWLKTYRYFNISAYVVFASDGLPADLQIAMDKVKQYAKLHIPIYTIFIGSSSKGYHALEEIAKTTGGKCFQATNAAQILDKYIKAAEEVKSNIIRSVRVTVTEKVKFRHKYLLEPYIYSGALIAYILAVIIAYMTRKITY